MIEKQATIDENLLQNILQYGAAETPIETELLRYVKSVLSKAVNGVPDCRSLIT